MTPSSCPEYCSLRTLSETLAYEAELEIAARDGAIDIQRQRFTDDPRIERIRLRDLARLGAHLGETTLVARFAAAEALLAEHAARHPAIVNALDAWRRGEKVLGNGPDKAQDLADAAHAMDRRREDGLQESLLRRESVRLFRDSKRLEALTDWLDLLQTGELVRSGLDDAQILAGLGLRREPSPLLIAGRGTLRVGEIDVPLCRPYLGAPADAVLAIDSPARILLSIENLASFHEAARIRPGDGLLLLYTGGMPSPAWRAAYTRLLGSLPDRIALYHWGDIDEGGFRIAAVLAATASDAGRILRPWLMSPEDIPADLRDTPVSPVLARRMQLWADRAGWPHIAEALQGMPLRIEQEALEPAFPPQESELAGD
ncbi:MAG: Wadjet anti-phage system protein JetD domain-containing protein [Pseudomonadota bacterium]